MQFSITFADGRVEQVSGELMTMAALNMPGYGDPAPVALQRLDDAGPVDLEILRRYGDRGFAISGSAEEVLERFKLEAESILLPNGASIPLRAWQVSRVEWDAVMAGSSVCYGVYPGLSKEATQHVFEEPKQVAGFIFSKRIENEWGNWLHARFGSLKQYRSDSGDQAARHDVHVAYACLEGLPVPESVLQECRESHNGSDLRWMPDLVAHPHLRGALGADDFQDVWCLCKGAGVELTEDVFRQVRAAITEIGQVRGFVAIDNALYAAGILPSACSGILQPAPRLAHADADIEFARQALRAHRRDIGLQSISKQNLSHRLEELEVRKLEASSFVSGEECDGYADRVVEIVRAKNTQALLDVLDVAADQNLVSKAIFERISGVKLKGLRSSARTRAIFEYCGFSPQQQTNYLEARQREAEASRRRADLQSELSYAKTVASRQTVDWQGRTVTGVQLVDQIQAAGCNVAASSGRGKSQRYMIVDSTGGGYNVSKEMHAYLKAKLALDADLSDVERAAVAAAGAEGDAGGSQDQQEETQAESSYPQERGG